MEALDRSSPVPLYVQLRDRLVNDFHAEGTTAGDRLPGDFELCERFKVSRTVVRQALTDLEYSGVIERVKGKGTFYAGAKVGEGLAQSLTGLYDDMATRGTAIESIVRRLEVVPADARTSADLELGPYQPVIVLERLRMVEGRPWALTISHIPYFVAPGLLDQDFRQASLYRTLEKDHGVRLASGHRSIEASVASESTGMLLGVGEGAPVLVLRSLSRDEAGRVVESFVAFHRGDRSRFEVELGREGTPDAPLHSVVVTEGATPRSDER